MWLGSWSQLQTEKTSTLSKRITPLIDAGRMPPSVPLPPSSESETGTNRITSPQGAKASALKFPQRSKSNKGSLRKPTSTKKVKRAGITRNQGEPINSLSDENNALASDSTSALGPAMMSGGMPMYGSPYFGGGMSPMMMGGPFSGVYQTLFGVQNVVSSLGQAVQILGMNQQAIQQAFDSLTSMVDHALATFNELRALETTQNATETDDQKRRRRRLRGLRWALVFGVSWLVYKIIKRLTTRRRRLEYGPISSNLMATRGNNNYSPHGGSGYGRDSPHGGSGYGREYSSMYGPSVYGGVNPGATMGGMLGYNSGSYY